ncbi:hypothetical protein ABW636_04370 [Aquimarina sp. 2201CG1-2-11]|uniref:hypothetical protein n=1 Tax=Aquimarina discodermiae TaxID=3231043 RepID=UPI003462DD44
MIIKISWCCRLMFLISLLLITTSIKGQSTTNLIGKWQTTYDDEGEKSYVTYEFKNVSGKLKCYTRYLKNDKGEGVKYTSLAMDKITLSNGKGNGKYKYNEGNKKYVFDAKLHLKNLTTLYVSYSFWGYSNTEIWKRIK